MKFIRKESLFLIHKYVCKNCSPVGKILIFLKIFRNAKILVYFGCQRKQSDIKLKTNIDQSERDFDVSIAQAALDLSSV
jgi:hypothetical protein